MITHEDIKNLVNEWRLREDIIEKDYVIGWLLWGIGSEPDLKDKWIFKGGTCLKKCYIETYRFSEDLDFTVMPNGPTKPKELLSIFERVLRRISEEAGIDFSVMPVKFKQNEKFLYTEGRIYYRGPRNSRNPSSVKLDISASEKIVRPPVLRVISHSYPDELPQPAQVKCYSFEEVFAEKIRAMGERSRPRDLYDIINLFRHKELQSQPELIKSVLIEKCKSKNILPITLSIIENSPYIDELSSEWDNMLGHQLQTLPPFEQYLKELPNLFNWLEKKSAPAKLASIPFSEIEDNTWSPPPTISSWGIGIPLESVRFAAVNHLCIEIVYKKEDKNIKHYLIEPYSLRRTKDNNLVLHAIKIDTQEDRTFRIDRIMKIDITTKSFEPKYQIEFSPTGTINALPSLRKTNFNFYDNKPVKNQDFFTNTKKHKTNFDPTYIFECSYCGKKFRRKKHDTKLNSHKDKNGWNCSGKNGYLVDTIYD